MEISDMGKKRKIYSKLLTTIALCISLTLLTSTMIYYTFYTNSAKTQAFRFNLSDLSSTSREVVNLTEAAQTLSFQLYRNSVINHLLFYKAPSIYDVTAAMSELNNYLNSMPYIESIYVYNSSNSSVFVASKSGQNGVIERGIFADRDILNRIDNFKDIKPFMPIPRVYFSEKESKQEITAYTFICFDAVNWNQLLNSAVIVNISASWINKEIYATNSSETTYILDDQGRFLSGNRLAAEKLSTTERTWIDTKIRDRSEGYFIDHFRGRNSLISFTSPDILGWQYVRITPYDIIAQQANRLRNTTLLISAIILLLGLFISSFISKRLYKPLDQIVDEMNNLETEKRNSMFTIRQTTLRNLILGLNTVPSGDQLNKLQRLGINFNFNEEYCLALLRIDHYSTRKFELGSYILPYKFAIMNIATEICGKTYLVENVGMDDDSIVLLLNMEEGDEEDNRSLIETLLRQIREACRDYLKISLSSTYSPFVRTAGQLNPMYRQLREASQHRLFYGHGSIINTAAVLALYNNIYNYPSDLEKKLIDALLNGKTEESQSIFSEILKGTREHSFQVVTTTISRLTVTIQSVIDNIHKRSVVPLDDMMGIPSLDSFETADELKQAFSQLFEQISERLSDKKSIKQNELIRLINEKIQQSYRDPNLSLNRIADELDMSPIYISRLYKQVTMSAIMDVVMEARMREVCKLLDETDLSVSTIADQTGFTSSSYLHRMFKRYYSVTPIEYRRSLLLKG